MTGGHAIGRAAEAGWRWVLVTAALLVSQVASAQTWTWGVSGAQKLGYVDNALYTTELDPAAVPLNAALVGWDLTAWVRGRFAGGWSLGIGYSGEIDLLISEDGTTQGRHWHSGALEGSVQLGRWQLKATLVGAGYQFDAFPLDRFAQLSGRLSASVSLGDFRVHLLAGAGGRWFIEDSARLGTTRTDTDLRTGVGGSWQHSSGFGAGLGYLLMGRLSNEASVERLYHTPYASVMWNHGGVSLSASVSATLRRSVLNELDVYYYTRLQAEYRPLNWLAVGARYALAADRAADSRLSFTSHEVLAFVRMSYVGILWEPPPAGVRMGGASGGVRAVTFRTRLAGATSVALVGDFNGWQGEEHPMESTGDGWFEVSVPLASGRYEYQYLVDGEYRTPPEATQLSPGAFGGTNAVLEVP